MAGTSRLTPDDADQLVKSELGDKYQTVNISGYWIIGWHEAGEWNRVSPRPRKTLRLAIADARKELAR